MGHLILRLKDADAVHNYFFGLGDKEHIYNSMVESIADGIEKGVDYVRIAEVLLDNGDDFIIDCYYEDWADNLKQAKEWYISKELYEYCPRIQELEDKIQIHGF